MRSVAEIKSMITVYPSCYGWIMDGAKYGFTEYPKMEFPPDITPEEKVLSVIVAFSQVERCARYRTIEKTVGVSKKEAKEIIKNLKELGLVETLSTFDEETGALSGSGFCITNRD
jgi:hypothetical protein